MSGAYTFQKGMERLAVVHVTEVAQLVEHDVIGQVCGKRHQPEVQVDIAKG